MTEKVITSKPLSSARAVRLTAEVISLSKTSDEEFLRVLPPAQQEIVRVYARDHGLSFRAAFGEIMKAENEENIADRGR